MRRFLIAITLFVTAAGFAPASFAQEKATPEKIALAKRYFKALEFDKLMDNMFKSMLPSLMEQQQIQMGLNSEKRVVVAEATAETMAEIMPVYMDRMYEAYAGILTEDELTQLVAFYESPLGQSVVKKTPQLSSKATEAMIPLMPEIQSRIEKKICAKVDCKAAAKAQP